MVLYFVTSRQEKFNEVKNILPLVWLKHDLSELQSLDSRVIVRHKLAEARKLGIPDSIVVEDVSVNLEALNGFPGPMAKWLMQAVGAQGIYDLLKDEPSGMIMRATVGLWHEGEMSIFEGAVSGNLVAPRGENGWGYDPIFQPDGWTQTYAQVDQAKNENSHRAIAFRQLRDFLGQ